MEAVKNHWVTALALLGTVFLLVVGIALIVTGGDDSSGEGVPERIVGVIAVLGGLAILGGLEGLRRGQDRLSISYALIVVGMIVLGVFFFWVVFVPLIVALVVRYAGVFRRGLERELKAT